jgi:uncharacterized membrane protein YedE/YeeE
MTNDNIKSGISITFMIFFALLAFCSLILWIIVNNTCNNKTTLCKQINNIAPWVFWGSLFFFFLTALISKSFSETNDEPPKVGRREPT